MHFFIFISLLYTNSDCLSVSFYGYMVTYVTTLLQLLAEDVISLVLPLEHSIDFKKRQAELRFCFLV